MPGVEWLGRENGSEVTVNSLTDHSIPTLKACEGDIIVNYDQNKSQTWIWRHSFLFENKKGRVQVWEVQGHD